MDDMKKKIHSSFNLKTAIIMTVSVLFFCSSVFAGSGTSEEPLLSDSVKMGFTTYDNINAVMSNYGFTGTDIKTFEHVQLIQRKDGYYESPTDVKFNFFSVVRTPLLYTIMIGATPLTVGTKGDLLPVFIHFGSSIEPLHVDNINPGVPDYRVVYTKQPGDPSVTKFSTPFRIVSEASVTKNAKYSGQVFINLVTDKTYFL